MKKILGYAFLCLFVLMVQQALAQDQSIDKARQERENTDSLTKVDYEHLLNMLHITLPVLPAEQQDPKRPKDAVPRKNEDGYTDAEGHSLKRTQWGDWINYNESKANNYVLSNPLVLNNGKKVTSVSMWWKKRRPEIVHDYETEVFGRVPKNTPKVKFEVTSIDSTANDGKAIKEVIVGHINNAQFPEAKPSIQMVLYLPKDRLEPVPLMVIASSNTAGHGQTIKLINNAGWGAAIFSTNAVQADNGAGLTRGIIGLINKGKPRAPQDWGVLRAWSWGLSRALDYFVFNKAINSKAIGIEGHSRWGKTALLAGAMDPRWAIVFASCSGSGGASLEKRNYGENIGILAGETEYHWFAPNFVKYGGSWDKLPVDAHEMISLVAPRPIFITGGDEDIWADPLGEFKACVAATPVYQLLGKQGIQVSKMPAPDVSLIKGDLAFREHKGGHTDSLDWPIFIEFAKRYLK